MDAAGAAERPRDGTASGGRMFSRDEIVGGMHARRASTVLFAIEARTAALVRANRVNRAAYVGERTAAEREQAFLGALASGRGEDVRVRVQDLERHATAWAPLVPDGVELRAALARLVGAKYRFTAGVAPGLARALGLDDPAVAAAFERQHGTPLAGIHAPKLSLRERARWARARLARRFEELPPFWVAYFLALTETIGEGILIVPVAVAAIGPVPAALLLVALGLVNIATLAALAEAVTRNGSMRYGSAYFGRLVTELLGPIPSRLQSLALAVFNLVVLYAYLLGFASVFTGATGVPEGLWVVLLFAINVVVLRRESLDDTIASAVVIGVINLGLVALISAIAATHVDPARLGYTNVPFLNGRPPDVATVGLVFGVVLVAFFGHTSVANASKLMLTRDPGGRSLILGNVAALATVVALYAVMVLAIGGAVDAEALAGTRGTAITPLAAVAGPAVNVLGSIYVVLALGIGSVYVTLGIYNQVIELAGGRAARHPALAAATRRRWSRLLLGLAPAAVVFLVLEAVLLLGADWFAGPIGYVGVLAVPLVGGIFPMLVFAAARRRGEYVPALRVPLIGATAVVGAVVALFVTGVLAHALVIWEQPVARAAAGTLGVGTVLLVGLLVRRGAFRPRTVVEIREDEARRLMLSVTAAGRSVRASEPLDSAQARSIRVPLDAASPDALRVRAHSVSVSGSSTPIPIAVSLGEAQPVEAPDGELDLARGSATELTVQLARRA